MLKTVLKVLAIYVILSALVSGCSLIGEYAEGMCGAEGNAKGSISSESESKQADEHHTEQSKQENQNIKITIDSTVQEEIRIELSSVSDNKEPIVKNERGITLQKDLPHDLIQIAFDEMKKRKRFYTPVGNHWQKRFLPPYKP